MNIKSILRSIRFLALLIGNMMMAGCSNSDKPAYLEPHLITTEATHITRTEATLNGSATIEGETEMPKLLFRYGTSESMNLNTSEVHAQGADVSLVLTGLKAGTTYYYMLQGNNGRTTTTSNMMSFTTQPNISPKLSSATLLSHGPMSAFVSYEITDDGGEPMTETGCYVYLTGEPEDKQKCIVENFDGKKGKIKLRIGNLERNAHYEFQPFARNRVGETIGTAIKYDTSDAITLNETGELPQLMGNHLYEYTQLTIAGTLNGEDLSCMRMMMGRDNDNAVTPGKLSDIDLTDVHLAAGGMVGPYHHEAAENQIVQGTFAGCEKLTHVVLPADATTIEKDAFADCTSLREIEIPASAGSILPSSGCTALEALTVSPANANYKSQDGVLLNAEGNRIVWFPMGKKGKYTLPSAFTSIGAYAFKECSIEAFYLSDNVKTLGQGAFMDSQIKEIHLGAGIKLIPTGVFQGCRKLTKVYLGANTEQISNYAFDGSPLTDLYVSASMIPYCEENAFANKVEGFFATCVLHVPTGMKKKYQNHKIWGKFTHIVEE